MNSAQIISLLCPNLGLDPRVNDFIALAAEDTSAEFFGSSYAKAVALKACHFYTLSQRCQGASGAISSVTEGKLSISFSGTGDGSELGQTSYGKQLAALIQQCSCGISVTL